jgi:hypothetical protein
MKDVHDSHDPQDALERRLKQLPGELPPARDLWPEIAARIEAAAEGGAAPKRSPWGRGGWRVAALAASVALAAVLVARFDRDPPPDTSATPALATAPATFGAGHELGSEYRAARAGLTHDLESRLEALSPEARETVMENLAVIRQAAAEIDAALAKDPGNGLLQQLLLAAYQDELSVLANMQRVTARLPPRNEI